MKLRTFSKLLFFAFVIMCIAPSCVKEGPAGPAGADGTNGVDGAAGSLTCLACHAGTNMDSKKSEFYLSEHSLGAVAVDVEGGRSGCSQCHSSEGFIEYATLGSAGIINKPSAWECATCHGIHSTFESTDYALRLGGPVKSNIDATYMFDFKNGSNLCVNCHQARTPEPSVAKPGATTFAVTVRIGPHHGPQGNLVAGVGFAEIPGAVAYPAKGTSKHYASSCTGCHMAPFDKAKSQGGHSLVPSLAKCNSCHSATDTNYDHNGKQTTIAARLVVFRDLLLAKGIISKTTVDGVDTYAPVVATIPMVKAQAAYNYFGLMDDRSEGVHNPPYITALIENSIAALNK